MRVVIDRHKLGDEAVRSVIGRRAGLHRIRADTSNQREASCRVSPNSSKKRVALADKATAAPTYRSSALLVDVDGDSVPAQRNPKGQADNARADAAMRLVSAARMLPLQPDLRGFTLDVDLSAE
jgi:hypothetical protein